MSTQRGTGPLAPWLVDALWGGAEELRDRMVDFARRLIRTPSLPGDEGAVAELVAAEMRALDYDEVYIDRAGNVVGHVKATEPPQGGRERPPRVMLNAHIDHVDVGDPTRWPHPPYDATLVEGEIWGRGASDLKGSVACQVYSGALLKRLNVPLPNDVYVAGVVLEERGGLGSAVLAEELPVDYVIVGEPSANRLALGHRGRYEVFVTITGKSVHASVPQSGINPLYSMSRFLLEVEKIRFEPDPAHPELGPTTIAPTLISTDQTSPNVVPGECKVILDVRNTPADVPDVVVPRVKEALDRSLEGGATGAIDVPWVTLTSYTGLARTFWGHGAFGVSPDSPLVAQARSALNEALKREVPTQIWRFATDAGHFVPHGVKAIGFGPGYEEVIHTVDERMPVEMLVEAMVGNAALALALK